MKIIIADDHKIVREGLRALIDKQQGMEVVGEADNGRLVVQMAKDLSPDVVIMDIAMPDMNGIEASRSILAELNNVKIIGLSMHSDRRFVVEMLKAGASGYLLKDCAFEELIQAIRTVHSDHIYLSPEISDIMIKDYVHNISDSPSVFSLLTTREREVFQLLAEGKSTKEIAFALGVSIKTVETYRQQVMEKLDIHSIAELTKFAIREGITSLND